MKTSLCKPRGRLVVIESPDPMDLLQGRSEAQTLGAACQLIGYETVSFNVRSSSEFADTCKYLSSITEDHDVTGAGKMPLFVHVSCHGNRNSLAFGRDFAEWDEIVEYVEPLCSMPGYQGGFVLSISACGAGEQQITNGLSASLRKKRKGRAAIIPPHYLFVPNGERVFWASATVGWVALYHRLAQTGLDRKKKIQESLQQIEAVSGLSLKYFRWDKNKKRFRQHGGGN